MILRLTNWSGIADNISELTNTQGGFEMPKVLKSTFDTLNTFTECSKRMTEIFDKQNNFTKLINTHIPSTVINCDSMVNNLPYYEVIYSV